MVIYEECKSMQPISYTLIYTYFFTPKEKLYI